MTIDKTFDPAAIEAKWYRHWEETGAFRPARPDAEPYTIVIPPPNVTGSLHIGHALDNTLQDILIRFERLRGKDALWVVGTDHAGIATQMVVERQLAAAGEPTRAELGREAFEARVWDWKRESGGQITRQLRRLGASCDWANERFTMDDGFSAAVRRVFVDLYNRGLIYRDKRLVNWDPKLKTAISDLEVETREVAGSLTHFRYPLSDGSGSITVATTRPETMLGDTAIAVNPADERYAALVGRTVRHPFDGRDIPIIADDWADPEFGSGAVKITPAHDFNDFEVGRRHPEIGPPRNIFDADARVIAEGPFRGLDRFEARERVVEALDAAGLLERVEEKTIQMPYGDRSGVVIEPWLTDQWYVNAKQLAEAPMAAVRSGETRFVPETWSKTFFQWMENIQPWCVSRQLWWGHRIPAWYGKAVENGRVAFPAKIFVVENDEEAAEHFRVYYGPEARVTFVGGGASTLFEQPQLDDPNDIWIVRDPDVLDTWFSSALWPFATLLPNDAGAAALFPLPAAAQPPSPLMGEGKQSLPHQVEGTGSPQASHGEGKLARHYPNSTLVTGFDIIFFWVARMQMMGHAVMGGKPFSTVYCHGLVRDAKGQKMSKSRGNTVDPLGLIDRYGADALRFTLAAMETQGRDIKLSEPRIEGYRNFATKLWNAARFAQGQGIGGSDGPEPPAADNAVNRWIIAETRAMVHAVTSALEAFRFDEAGNAVYAHSWGRFCDWYLELAKPLLAEPGAAADETRRVAGWALDQILVTLHPFMPFITEELWHALSPRTHDLILAAWPQGAPMDGAADAPAAVDLLIRLIEGVRAARAELNVPAAARLPLHVTEADDSTAALVRAFLPALTRLARVSDLHFAHPPAGGAAQIVLRELTASLPLEGVIDLAAERARLTKSRDAAQKEAASLSGRLSNPGFLAKAAPEAVDKAREDLAAREAEAARLSAALERLG